MLQFTIKYYKLQNNKALINIIAFIITIISRNRIKSIIKENIPISFLF